MFSGFLKILQSNGIFNNILIHKKRRYYTVFFLFLRIFKNMKKNIVLFVLFVLPIVAYLFFASGVNSFTKLPTVTKSIPELGEWKSLRGDTVVLDNKITILGFSGYDVLKNRGNIFNLTAKIYKQYNTFQDLQFVYICPIGTEKDVQKVQTSLSSFVDVVHFNFVFASPEAINKYHSELKLRGKL